MYCDSCGTSLNVGANFCQKCGKAVQVLDAEKAISTEQSHIEAFTAGAEVKNELARIAPVGASKVTVLERIISAFLLVLLIGSFAGVLVPAIFGETLYDSKTSGGLVLISSFSFWFFWKRFNRRSWVGAVVGIVVAFLVAALGGAIQGYVRSQPAYILEHTPLFVALRKNYPQVAEQIGKEAQEAFRDKAPDLEQFKSIVLARLMPVAYKALVITSDEALLQFAVVKGRQFQEVANSNPSDGLILMSGNVASAPPEVQKRIWASTSKTTQAAIGVAFVRVLNEVDPKKAPAPKDQARFRTLYNQLDETLIRKYGSSANYFIDESTQLSDDVKCKAGLFLHQETLQLPVNDRSFMLRNFFAAD